MLDDKNRCFFIIVSLISLLFFLFIFIFSFGKIDFTSKSENSIILYIFVIVSFIFTVGSFLFLIIVSKLDKILKNKFKVNDEEYEQVEKK